MDIFNNPAGEAQCICGALLDNDSATLCRKCTARARWHRRRGANRRHANPDRRDGDLG